MYVACNTDGALYQHMYTWSCVRDVRHTCDLFTSTIKLASHISKTAGLIFAKFTYFMLYIYTMLVATCQISNIFQIKS